MNITVTPAAQDYFFRLVESHGAQGIWLGLRGGGCAGFEYEWQIIGREQQTGTSQIIEYAGWQLHVDEMSLVYLLGSTIDYLTDITGSRVVVDNPLATSSCGCGTSVSFGV